MGANPQISKKKIEDAIKNYDKNCTQQQLTKRLDILFDTTTEIIQKYKSGENLDSLKTMENKLRQASITENQIKDNLDHWSKNILKNRNEIWIPKLLITQSEEGITNVFVAAGFFHFIGPFMYWIC